MNSEELLNLEFNHFQIWVASKMKSDFASPNEAIACNAMGLAGETGELIDYLKKSLFHHKIGQRSDLVKELGDILFYTAAVARLLGIDLSEAVVAVHTKLEARYPEGFDSSRAHAPGETPIEERFPRAVGPEESSLPPEERSSVAQASRLANDIHGRYHIHNYANGYCINCGKARPEGV